MSTARFPSGDPDLLRPPHERGTLRAFALAALFHLLLIALIALGVRWKSHPPDAVEAELWSPTVQRAAPRPTAPIERKQPQPEPQPAPPPPAPKPVVEPTPQPQQQADIVLRQQREAALKKQQEQAALERRLKEEERKLAAERKRLAEQKRREEEQRLAAEKLAERQRLREQQREERQKLAEQKLLAEQRQKKLEQQQAQLAASVRDDYMKQLMQQAGTGAATSTGAAAQTSGPSGTYAARIASLVRENVIYPEINQISGDPRVTVLVNLAPDGTVLTAKVQRSSGVPSWDQAVLRAIERVGRFPPDENGKIWTPMLVKAGPRDPG
jgi:colicin import membrane protein